MSRQFDELGARAPDSRLDRVERAGHGRRDLLIGHAVGLAQGECHALLGRKAREEAGDGVAVLERLGGGGLGQRAAERGGVGLEERLQGVAAAAARGAQYI